MLIVEEGTVLDWNRSRRSVMVVHAESGVGIRLVVPMASHQTEGIRGKKQFHAFVLNLAAVASLRAEEAPASLGDVAYIFRARS